MERQTPHGQQSAGRTLSGSDVTPFTGCRALPANCAHLHNSPQASLLHWAQATYPPSSLLGSATLILLLAQQLFMAYPSLVGAVSRALDSVVNETHGSAGTQPGQGAGQVSRQPQSPGPLQA